MNLYLYEFGSNHITPTVSDVPTVEKSHFSFLYSSKFGRTKSPTRHHHNFHLLQFKKEKKTLRGGTGISCDLKEGLKVDIFLFPHSNLAKSNPPYFTFSCSFHLRSKEKGHNLASLCSQIS